MNFIFISPNFPESYWMFCQGLKKHNVNVLAIGDAPYDELSNDLKNNVNEYYKVGSMENYDEMLKAVAYFTFKYGKIDWIESNNEYWLKQDARLRKDFNVKNGFSYEHMCTIQCKSKMKEFYAKAEIPTARYEMASTYDAAKAFIEKVGYPIVIKPDVGVGSSDTNKIKNDADLQKYFETPRFVPMIMEEYIDGSTFSFDGLADSNSDILFMTNHLYRESIMDAVNNKDTMGCYSAINIAEDIVDAGKRCLKAFEVKNRFFHFEFFRLNSDCEGVGKKGDIVGLEVNMRPPGGFLPDLINYANDCNVYQLWADMMIKDCIEHQQVRKYSSGFCGRFDTQSYKYTSAQIKEMYPFNVLMTKRLPKALAEGMGDEVITARFESEEKMLAFFDVCSELI